MFNADPTGIPVPDGLIGFPDLLVFAQNYAVYGDHSKEGGVYKMASSGPIAITAEVPGFMKAGSEHVVSLTVDNSSAILGYNMWNTTMINSRLYR